MGELRLPGLATGIDTATLIRQLMIINSRRLATYQVRKTGYEAQNTALSELRTKVAAVQSAVGALSVLFFMLQYRRAVGAISRGKLLLVCTDINTVRAVVKPI